jgi:hypothetical protein
MEGKVYIRCMVEGSVEATADCAECPFCLVIDKEKTDKKYLDMISKVEQLFTVALN